MDKLKAYEVRESNEGNCVIVYAGKNVVARRHGAEELGCEFEEVESCTRAPWADQYAPGPVPLHASLAAGWWHGCCGCGCEFDADGIRGLEDDKQPDIDPVQDSKGMDYCSPGCMMADWQKRQTQKALEAAAIEYCLSRQGRADLAQPTRWPALDDGRPDPQNLLAASLHPLWRGLPQSEPGPAHLRLHPPNERPQPLVCCRPTWPRGRGDGLSDLREVHPG